MTHVKWKIFERNAALFLKDLYEEYSFEVKGNSDSTASDIICKKEDNNLLNIEAKFLPAQSGQIVLLKKNNLFEISEQSYNQIIAESKELLEIVNTKYLKNINYPITINTKKELLYNWIIKMYATKGSEWLICSNKFENLTKENTYLLPIKDIEKICDVKAVLRVKRSGTRYLPKKDEDEFKKEAKDILGDIEIIRINDKPCIRLEKTPPTFYIGDKFFLTINSNNNYLIKKRAITNNLNILFQLNLKKDINTNYFNEFKELINNL